MQDSKPETLTAQELIYAATGFRVLAMQARADADRQESPTVRGTFERAEQRYLELIAKCERMAKAATVTPAPTAPVRASVTPLRPPRQ